MARTAVATKSQTSVAQADIVKALSERLMAPSGNKITLGNDKKFTLPDGLKVDRLSVVIVDFVYYNAFYDKAYSPNSHEIPKCFSLSESPRKMKPSENSLDIQDTLCADCLNNQFGSKETGGKLCQNRIRVAVLPTDATEDTEFFMLDVSPTAIRGFSSYIGAAMRATNLPPHHFITDVEADRSSEHATMAFSNPQKGLSKSFIGMVEARLPKARKFLMREPELMKAANDAPIKPVKPVKVARPKRRMQ